ncbi:hypothetical protein CLU96_1244 [Chryseobacterium sp. 52]|uniref:hypothetical protein n=1 Tax=Chryseobacterium sp. 52 TaxID=2035213 RepID=UPI000C17FC38|nr:hypothetical protein [Chryseobacterium sp. 52]PIF44303.1 hypothetical protein CLU96_1244 [Chryseobacterium sp. 52]
MRTELWIDNISIDLEENTNIKYTLQVNDIADISSRQSSFTNQFTAPKTPKNVRTLKGLSLPSDSSNMPYLKPDCKLKHEGFDLIKKGWLKITESDDEYKLYTYSGLENFFKAIENKTLGNDLVLTEINHVKDVANVAASYAPGSPFKYFLADYNGQTHFLSDPNIINIDYLVPSVNVKYLWDKVHDRFNSPYSGGIFDSPEFKSLYITYPKAPNVSGLYKLISAGNNQQRYLENSPSMFMPLAIPNSTGGIPWRYSQYLDIAEDGNYKITFEVLTDNPAGTSNGALSFWLGVNSEGINPQDITNKVLLVNTNPKNFVSVNINRPLAAGSVLQIFMKKEYLGGPSYIDMGFLVRVEKIDKETVDFQDGLGDFLITDFMKVIFNRFGLTIFPNEDSNDLQYETISERVSTGDVIDWSDKYIERTSEEYVSRSYAQRNIFQYQYNDKEGSYYDGYLDVSNLNLDASKVLFKCKTYAPERIKTKFRLNVATEIDSDVFKFYEKQANDNPALQPNYKGLEKRFYFIRQSEGFHAVTIGSNTTNEQQIVPNALVGSFNGLDWQNILGKYYGDYAGIINESRRHDIDLDIDLVDTIQLDFSRLYYFKQEQQYYILNKLNFDSNTQKASGEFVRVKRKTETALVSIGVDIDWIDTNINSTSTWSHYQLIATIIGNPTYIWQTRLNSGVWVDVASNVTSFDYQFTFGINDVRVSYTNGVINGVSNIKSYERKIEQDPNKCYRFSFKSLSALPRTIDYVGTSGQITSTILNFANATEIQTLDAKAILSMGGATLVDQQIINCPAIVCKIYRISFFMGSGDSYTIDYIDCSGITRTETQYGPPGPGQNIEFDTCAREGTFSSTVGFTEVGTC